MSDLDLPLDERMREHGVAGWQSDCGGSARGSASPAPPFTRVLPRRPTVEQLVESERIRALIYEHRRQTAAREAERALSEEQT